MLLENYKPILLYLETISWNFTILFGVREIMLQKGKWKKFAVNVSHFNTDNQRDRQTDRQTYWTQAQTVLHVHMHHTLKIIIKHKLFSIDKLSKTVKSKAIIHKTNK